MVRAQRFDREPQIVRECGTVIDEDHSPSSHVGWCAIAAVEALTALELLLLPHSDRVDSRARTTEPVYHVIVEHSYAAGRDGTDRVLRIVGDHQLAHQENIE